MDRYKVNSQTFKVRVAYKNILQGYRAGMAAWHRMIFGGESDYEHQKIVNITLRHVLKLEFL